MRAYFDHNATSPLRPEALHAEGRAARAAIERARAEVAALAGTPAREIVFVSGGSEAVSAAVRGVCERAEAGRRAIVAAAIEHSAVLEAARAMERQGFSLRLVPPEADGRVDPARFARALDGTVALAALQAANNETGAIQEVAPAGQACRAARVPFLVDAVQAAGKIGIDREGWEADLLAISGHKLGGPQGTGALVVRDGLEMARLIHGGAQERRRRAGTEPVAAIAGFGAACVAAARDLDREGVRLAALRRRIEDALEEIDPGVRIYAAATPRLPNTICAAFPGVRGETLAIALDLAGFAVATGSACASGAVEPSHVLVAMGGTEEDARGAIRISLGWSTTEDEVARLLDALPAIVLRARMARS
jgi:cysteine desulfurase